MYLCNRGNNIGSGCIILHSPNKTPSPMAILCSKSDKNQLLGNQAKSL